MNYNLYTKKQIEDLELNIRTPQYDCSYIVIDENSRLVATAKVFESKPNNFTIDHLVYTDEENKLHKFKENFSLIEYLETNTYKIADFVSHQKDYLNDKDNQIIFTVITKNPQPYLENDYRIIAQKNNQTRLVKQYFAEIYG